MRVRFGLLTLIVVNVVVAVAIGLNVRPSRSVSGPMLFSGSPPDDGIQYESKEWGWPFVFYGEGPGLGRGTVSWHFRAKNLTCNVLILACICLAVGLLVEHLQKRRQAKDLLRIAPHLPGTIAALVVFGWVLNLNLEEEPAPKGVVPGRGREDCFQDDEGNRWYFGAAEDHGWPMVAVRNEFWYASGIIVVVKDNEWKIDEQKDQFRSFWDWRWMGVACDAVVCVVFSLGAFLGTRSLLNLRHRRPKQKAG